MKTFRGTGREIFKRFKLSGEFRYPKKGEWYLSGAIREAYLAPDDLREKYFIVIEASFEDFHCPECNQLIPASE